MKNWKPWLVKFWRETARPIAILLLVTTALRSAVADWNDVPTGSMNPTIIEGDRVFVNKLAYDLKVPFTTWHLAQWGDPKRGDIIVFYSPVDGIRLVKRVVGLPGDRIEVVNEQLFINGQPSKYEPLPREIVSQIPETTQGPRKFYDETASGIKTHEVAIMPWSPASRSFGPFTVAPDHYFVMGDNRDNSFDSRFWKERQLTRDRIVGRALLVVLSFDHEHHWMPRWSRFFRHLT
jgi:signal peptidase I